MADPVGWEYNDDFAHATEITAGTYTNLEITAGDMDYYNISLAVGNNISIEIYNMPTKLGMYLTNTASVTMNSSSGDVAQKVWWISVPVAGNYTIVVYGINPSDESTYDMRIEAPAFDDTFEANDDYAHATSRPEVSTTPNLQLYDADYYDVAVDAADFLNVTIQRSSDGTGSGQFTLEVFDYSLLLLGSVLLDLGASSTLFVQQVEDSGMVLHVVVSPMDQWAWGNYTLILQEIGDDAWEDNDAYDAAKPINLDDPATIFALRDDGAFLLDDDYYQVQLNAGDTLWESMSMQPTGHVAMQIRTTTDALLADTWWPTGTDASVNYTATTTGPVNFRVYNTSLSHLVQYYPTIGRLNVTHPGDISYAAGASGSSITWKVDDSYLANPVFGTTPAALLNAQVYRDGVALEGTYTWSRTQPVTVDVAGLAEGTHTFKIVSRNSLNVTVEDTVVVIVTAGGVPGYPVVELAGFALVAVIALAFRKKRVFSQE